MSYKKNYFQNNQPVHVISRAVEERKIFNDESDCYRFIFQCYAANLGKPALNLRRLDVIKSAQSILNGEDISTQFIIKEHPPLVHIIDFALVVTHYHFYLLPNVENGIPLFMQKLNGGFAKYFNLKNGRKGALFSSRYKSVPVEADFQSDAVSQYISIINPLDVYQPGWREGDLKDPDMALKFLENYQFSSFPDKIGKRCSKILAAEEILDSYFLGKDSREKKYNNFEKFVKDFLQQKTKYPIFDE